MTRVAIVGDCLLFTYSIFFIGKYTDIFQGRKEIFRGRIFYGENFPLGWKFLGVNFSGEILRGGNLYTECLLFVFFLVVDPIVHVETL
jgi:hypothetical protein